MNSRLFTFVAGTSGPWRVDSMTTRMGEPLDGVPRLEIISGAQLTYPEESRWILRGVTSNERYATREEKSLLAAKQPALGRSEATCAALIPIRKSPEWWTLAQDERRRIIEERSDHIKIGLRYLPAIARRLHHCRDLGDSEPFDFLTWFEFAPSDAPAFDELLHELRASEEWKYVDREAEIRLVLAVSM